MKYCYLLISSLLLFLNPVKSQDVPFKRKATIESFINAVFRDNKSPQFIMENYMYLPLNDTISSKKIEEFNSNLIDALKKKHSGGVSSSNYKIVPYGQFKGEKKLFSGSSQDIVILTVQNKPAIYFYFYEDKISSFTLMEKGKYGYFIMLSLPS